MPGVDQYSIDLADSDTLENFYFEQTNTETHFLQLSTGAAILNARCLDLEDIRVVQVQGEGQHLWHDKMLSDEWRFAILTEAEGGSQMGRTELSPRVGHLLRPGEEAPLRTNGFYSTLELIFPETLPSQMGWVCLSRNMAVIDEDVVRALRRATGLACASADCRAGDPIAISHWRAVFLDLLELALMPWLIDISTHRSSTFSTTHSDLILKARQLLLNSDAEQVTDVEALASNIGVSRRRVFQAFKSELGIGPRRFREVVRLNALRSHLLQETPETASVTLLANEHGFSELGRLAGTYRRTFGELPSETLRRNCLREF